MLSEPLSKVSVPLTVVILTAVSAAARAIEPPVNIINIIEVPPRLPDATHVFPVIFVIVMFPLSNYT